MGEFIINLIESRRKIRKLQYFLNLKPFIVHWFKNQYHAEKMKVIQKGTSENIYGIQKG